MDRRGRAPAEPAADAARRVDDRLAVLAAGRDTLDSEVHEDEDEVHEVHGDETPDLGGPGRDDRTDGASRRRRPGVQLVANIVGVVVILLSGFLVYGRMDNRWYHLVTVDGGSMEPTYSIGDVLVLTRPPEQLEEGMVVTMQIEGAIVTHRIIETNPDGSFVTQGDANETPDDFAGLDVNVVGVVSAHLPWIGSVVGGTRTSAWMVDSATATLTTTSP